MPSAGLIEVDLGGDLIKQRVAQAGAGKRGGYRTVIAYRRRDGGVPLGLRQVSAGEHRR